MAKVRVYNDNKYEHRESFRGETIIIPPGDFVEMEREDAVLFKSAFVPPKFDKGGIQDPQSYKMIRIAAAQKQKPDAPDPSKDFLCMACGYEAKSAAGLKSHIRHQHQGQMIDDEAREEIAR